MDPSNGPWLYGYALSGHKGIRDNQLVRIGPLAQMNFLVGRNNHGKSTVMRAAGLWAASERRTEKSFTSSATLHPVPRRWFTQATRSLQPHQLEAAYSASMVVDLDPERVGMWIEGVNFEVTSEYVTGMLQRTLLGGLRVGNLQVTPPTGPIVTVTIPAFRELRPFHPQPSQKGTSRPNLASGEGLVRELGSWANPPNPGTDAYREAERRWEQLQRFTRVVLEEPDARLQVANSQEDLHVRLSQAGEMLHIDELGDGIKQVLMIAAASILYADHLVMLEEPEIHLHAGLQRKLMRFLSEETKNQYIIATHSAHVLDLPGARIFHVTHDGQTTRVSPAVRASQVQKVCQDLGYMASDLLQANYVVWVEGPSDRVYWERWLNLVDPDLVQGVHFTIMAYGGYLIDNVHLQDEPDPTVKDLVHLLQLGRQCSVVADSDKQAPDGALRPQLDRLIDEAAKPGSGHLIVCDWASTVENLVPRDLFRDTVIKRHPTAGPRLLTADKHTPFMKPFDRMGASTYSKVEIAQLVAPQLAVAHLDERLNAVVSDLTVRIRQANGLALRAVTATEATADV